MSSVQLWWIPLGAGGWFVRRNGALYERACALVERRPPQPLFHSALTVSVDGEQFAIELCPEAPGEHGRVAGGAVGSPLLAPMRVFRYEARCWRGGEIPDLEYAVGGPIELGGGDAVARELVADVAHVPTPTWGRDELHAGEMWNSNSVIAWLVERAGLDAASLTPPSGGRAPGWKAGVTVAGRGL